MKFKIPLFGMLLAFSAVALTQDAHEVADAVLLQLEREGFVGSVLVARNGSIEYAGDFGFPEEPPFTPSYWIASITKQFVATGILLLHERGELDINDPVSAYLAAVPDDKAGITLFQLLTHTSGLRQNYAADGIANRHATPMGPGAMQRNWGFRGATGMRASVPDLFSFLQALETNDLLSEESAGLLQGNHIQTAGGTEIGFNWFGRRLDNGQYAKFSRGQESFGGNAVIYVYPEQGLTIITATNAGPAETGDGAVTGWSRVTHEALAEIYLAD